jgi:hypothetical protein
MGSTRAIGRRSQSIINCKRAHAVLDHVVEIHRIVSLSKPSARAIELSTGEDNGERRERQW